MSLWLLPIPDKASLFAPALFYWFSQPLPLLAKKFLFYINGRNSHRHSIIFLQKEAPIKNYQCVIIVLGYINYVYL